MGTGFICPAFPPTYPLDTHTPMHSHMCTHTCSHAHSAHTLMHTHARAHARTQCIHACTHMHTRAQCAYTPHTCTHMHTLHTHAHTAGECVSDEPPPVSAPLQDPGSGRLDGSNSGAEVSSWVAAGRPACPVSPGPCHPGRGDGAAPCAALRGLDLSPQGPSPPSVLLMAACPLQPLPGQTGTSPAPGVPSAGCTLFPVTMCSHVACVSLGCTA